MNLLSLGTGSTFSRTRRRRFVFMLLMCNVLASIFIFFRVVKSHFEEVYKGHAVLPDAFVFITMQPLSTSMTVWAVKSLIRNGGWTGDVFLLTDFDTTKDISDGASCLRELVHDAKFANVHLISVPKGKNPKHLKAQVFMYIPERIRNVIYMDSDVQVTAPLSSSPLFSEEVPRALFSLTTGQTVAGVFLDAAGHAWGNCTKCDVYNSGIMLLDRHGSEEFLREWLLFQQTDAHTEDQESLEDVVNKLGVKLSILPYKYMFFQKDVLRHIISWVMWRRRPLFVHFTGLARMSASLGVCDHCDKSLPWTSWGYRKVLEDISACPSHSKKHPV
eukprot:m.13803 g.13803  ORF g.13803 m.13803 type:complete len:331 (-) comp4927_c0_seq1:42-1034(-)